MSRHPALLSVVFSILLTACATTPPRTPPSQAIKAKPTSSVTIIAPPAITGSPAAPADNTWDRLRGSFAMADCDADPSVTSWARRYTRNPRQFEDQLRAVLPRLAYVQQVAAQYDVAGEFVLLPWVESHFKPVATNRRRPAGMWQIMPVTAGAMGLRVDGHYDGRLDVTASARAVMKLLKQYHDQFHDWRLADYAYNAGEFSIRKLVRKHGAPAEEPVIPALPVRKVTRAHLTKLLAIACVVREPARFNVSLPVLPDEQHLVQVKIPRSMPMGRAADRAGMPVLTLKDLNAAFRSDMIDVDASSYLLLPASHARQFQDDLLAHPPMEALGETDRGGAIATTTTASPKAASRPKTHTVQRGESLWQIARSYSVGVSQLQRWNHLHGHALKLGQVLRVTDSE